MRKRTILWLLLLILLLLPFTRLYKVYSGYDPGVHILSSEFNDGNSIHVVWIRESLVSVDEVKDYGEYSLFSNVSGNTAFNLDQILLEEFLVFSVFGIKIEFSFSGPVVRESTGRYVYLRDVILD